MLRLAEEERQRAPLPPAPPPPAPKPTPPPANPLGLPRPLASRPKRPTPADGALRRRAAEVLGAFCADPSAGVAALVEFLAVDVAREGQNPLTRDFLTRHVRVFAEGRLPIGDLTEAIMDTIDHARAPGHYLSKSLANLTRTPRQTTIPALTEARTP
jgi:hypothetical protein